MKRAISFLLLFGLLLSLCLVPVYTTDSAETTDPLAGRTNAALGATYVNKAPDGYQYWSGQAINSKNATDGVITHNHNSTGTFFNIQVAKNGYALNYWDDKVEPSKYGDFDRFDINGSRKQSGSKYLAYFTFEMKEQATVDTLRVFLDEIDENGNPCIHMLDGLDIAVSTTGASGSWTVVYSGEKIQCEKNYEVYEDGNGNKTAYVKASFAPPMQNSSVLPSPSPAAGISRPTPVAMMPTGSGAASPRLNSLRWKKSP